MSRLRPLFTILLLCLSPALFGQGLGAITAFNGRTELEGGASIMDFAMRDADADTRVSLTASAGVLHWGEGQGSVRVHADVLVGVDRWRWTLGPVVDFEDPSKPGAGLRLTGGYEIFPHAVAALGYELLAAPHDADGKSAGTHGSLGLSLRIAF